MRWNHIMQNQPDDGRSIVQIDRPCGGHYSMGMRDYVQGCTWKQYLDWMKQNSLPNPDFWWMYSEDFPFPDKI